MESLEADDAARKMQKYGIGALSDIELLALFLRTGTHEKSVMRFSHDLLRHFGSLYGLLSASEEEMMRVGWHRGLPSLHS
ncbi:DNA repair protein RadC [Kluyvera cryocrescens]|uniref:DNA repair protein RadC n=1 Tax=Kluyvera cryocrescens TaxID=580 RepID=A0A485AYJ9_KLUCR|nr:DNA repair protein RadC [Kluyvera cryocrescens]